MAVKDIKTLELAQNSKKFLCVEDENISITYEAVNKITGEFFVNVDDFDVNEFLICSHNIKEFYDYLKHNFIILNSKVTAKSNILRIKVSLTFNE